MLALALDRFLERASVAQKLRSLDKIERTVERALAVAFDAQGKAFVKRFASLQYRFQESVSPADWLPLLDEVKATTDHLFWQAIQDGIGQALQIGADDTIAALGDLGAGISFTLKHPVAVEYLRTHAAWAVTQIDDTTRDYLNTIITTGVDEGWSYDRMARAIIDRYAGFGISKPQLHIRSRAHLIAITEMGQAYELAGRAVVDDLAAAGLDMEKQWLTVGDNRVSDGCKDNQAAGWVKLDSEFPSGHQHPLRFPGCRCTVLYRRKPRIGR